MEMLNAGQWKQIAEGLTVLLLVVLIQAFAIFRAGDQIEKESMRGKL